MEWEGLYTAADVGRCTCMSDGLVYAQLFICARIDVEVCRRWEFPWVPWVPWESHGNGNKDAMGMGMGMGIS